MCQELRSLVISFNNLIINKMIGTGSITEIHKPTLMVTDPFKIKAFD